ncbi:MAG: hypothetical protein ACFE9Q_16085 [Candidatus Hodarchaeota archaeon]
MQTATQVANKLNLLQSKRDKLRKLLLNYINFLIKCLNGVETKKEARRILDSLKTLETNMWIQNQSNEELSFSSYLREERKIYQEIDNLYLPY